MKLEAMSIDCDGDRMVGLLHRPAQPARRGVLIVVGGPQYRVGAGRQFVTTANGLAANGIPVLRFDYRGMGDSDGEPRGFLHIDRDIDAAIGAFVASIPELEEVVLWGLCDAAAAIMMYAPRDPRVAGIVLLNPWVRCETGHARVLLRRYYGQRFLSPAFWAKIRQLEFKPLVSFASFIGQLVKAVNPIWSGRYRTAASCDKPVAMAGSTLDYQERMLRGVKSFPGPVMLILSGNDHTAQEFELLAQRSAGWSGLLADDRVQRHRIADADHTFSRNDWRQQVVALTLTWVAAW